MTDSNSCVFRASWKYEAKALIPAALILAIMPITHGMLSGGRLSFWGYLEALLGVAVAFGLFAYFVRCPTLFIDPQGVRLRTLQYSWAYDWKDVDQIGEFRRRTGPRTPTIGLLLKDGVKPQHPMGEAAGLSMYGYQAMIPDMWNAPIETVRERLDEFHKRSQI